MNNPDIPDRDRRPEAADEERTAAEYAADEQATRPILENPTRPLADERTTHPTTEQPTRPLHDGRPAMDPPIGEEPPPAPPAPQAPAPRPVKRGIPLGTLVFGLASLVVALALLANAFLDVVVDPAVVVVLILIGAGAIMVIGGIAATRRRQDADARGPGSDPDTTDTADTTDPHVRG